MQHVRVVLAHHDPASVEEVVRPIQHQFLNFAIVNTTDELRKSIAGSPVPLAVVDLELAGFSQVGELCHEFPTTAFVCIHRLADDAMWSQSLTAGAVDCCYSSDLLHILETSERYVAFKEAQTTSAA